MNTSSILRHLSLISSITLTFAPSLLAQQGSVVIPSNPTHFDEIACSNVRITDDPGLDLDRTPGWTISFSCHTSEGHGAIGGYVDSGSYSSTWCGFSLRNDTEERLLIFSSSEANGWDTGVLGIDPNAVGFAARGIGDRDAVLIARSLDGISLREASTASPAIRPAERPVAQVQGARILREGAVSYLEIRFVGAADFFRVGIVSGCARRQG